MLEKIKGYISENRRFFKCCLWLLSVCCLFIILGFLDKFYIFENIGYRTDVVYGEYLENGKYIGDSDWILDTCIFFENIFFLGIVLSMIWLFYFINLLIVLNYKKICSLKETFHRILRMGIGILILEIVQLLLFIKMRDNRFILTTFVNLLIMLIPYILMLLVQLKSIKIIKEELKDILLSLLITMIVYMLIDIENVVLVVSMYSMIYIFVDKRLKVLKEKKVLIIGYIITIILIAYIERNEIRMYGVNNEARDEYQGVIENINNRTGECYMRIYGKKKICGKIIKGKEEGKWISLYKNGKKYSEGIYKNGEEEGKWIYWYASGNKMLEGIYREGEKEGKWIGYFDDEGIMEDGYYKEGKKEGKWIKYYDNGKKESEGYCKEGEREGKWIEYYEDGKKKSEVTYKEGKEIERIEYDEDGNRIEW